MEPFIIQLAETPKDWTDYLTLGANVFGPVITAIFGIWILRITKNIEHSQWRNQKLIEKRIAVWDDVAPKINDIYCYCMRVGAWKNVSPKGIVALKRETDKTVHTFRSYFSPVLFTRYMEFIETCFAVYQGHGVDAKVKTPLQEHKSAHENWQPEWDKLFFETPSAEGQIQNAYLALQQQIAAEMSVGKGRNA